MQCVMWMRGENVVRGLRMMFVGAQFLLRVLQAFFECLGSC